jgi:ankyrin repeat protein
MDSLFELAREEDRVGFRDALLLAKQQGVDVNQRSHSKWTLLHASAYHGRRENVVELLRGAGRLANFHEVNAVNDDGMTAVHYACERGHTGVMEELVEGAGRAGGFVAFAETNNFRWTALHAAKNEETVGLLLRGASRVGGEERHALVHATTPLGETAMHLREARGGLLRYCSDDELDFLLLAKNKEGHNPLHYTAYCRNENSIRILLGGVRERGWRGAKEQEEWRNSLNDGGLTALHIAIAFPYFSSRSCAGAVGALLSPGGEGEARGGGAKRKQHPDEGEEEDKEEGRKREERRYEGGVDPNLRCKGRTMECELLRS